MKGDHEIEGLGLGGDTVRLTLDRPIDTYSLSPEEAFALSRIEGDPPLEEALLAIGLPGAKSGDLLRSLRAKGLVRIGQGSPRRAAGRRDADEPPQRAAGRRDAIEPPPGAAGRRDANEPPRRAAGRRDLDEPPRRAAGRRDLDEPGIQLDPDERRGIREMETALATAKHWELLGIGRTAAADEVNDAYLELSRRFHPDRYYGRELGSYRQSLDSIFSRLKEAEATLSDPDRRAAYLAANPEVRTAAQQEQDEVTARRRAERNDWLRKNNPLVRRAQGAAMLAAQAKRLEDEGRFAEASVTFTAAAGHGRSDAMREAAEGAARRARQERATKALKAGAAARRSKDLDEARSRFLEAGDASEDPVVAIEALNAFLDCGGDPEVARRRAAELVKAAPASADAHALQGRILLAAGADKAGQAAVERALRLDPAHPFATSLRRKRRWPF